MTTTFLPLQRVEAAGGAETTYDKQWEFWQDGNESRTVMSDITDDASEAVKIKPEQLSEEIRLTERTIGRHGNAGLRADRETILQVWVENSEI